MQSRLFETLGGWSILEDSLLRSALDELIGGTSVEIELSSARQLFAKALETPEGLKVQTIHAFCERILARFPIEAGILPGYDPLDERETKALQAAVRDDIYAEAMADPDGGLNQAVQLLTAAKADQTLEEFWAWMAKDAYEIEAWAQGESLGKLADVLGLSQPPLDVETVKRQGWQAAPHDALRAAAGDMRECSKQKDNAKGERLSCLLYTSPSPRDATLSRMPSSA